MLTPEESMRMLVQLYWQAEDAIVRLINLVWSFSRRILGIATV